MQSRNNILLESVTNVVVGYSTGVLTQLAVFRLFGITMPMGISFIMGTCFTTTSVVRSYALRRLFNRREGHR
jgi:hypothetical protein